MWFDPDDLRHRIDISSQPRLRKLRANPDERHITAADYQQRLRAVYSNLQHEPSWVQGRSTAGEDGVIDPLTTSRGVTVKHTGRLPAGHLDIQALKDANLSEPSQVSGGYSRVRGGGMGGRCGSDESKQSINFRSTDCE